ncbi:unnamed protein product [Adineta steineri]|uniref:Uncharacterized protein n=1 Tax=Adineta steineri TaxID=433720 RepID=A0A815GEU7_9BILA|nr:unnamed protein product [Adineta steineri]
MNKLIQHVRNCNDFTIDTEGERSTNELALMQIQTIPRNAPLVVILIEIMNLPLNDTIIYVKIKQCLELIFKSENNLYGWGELIVELRPAIKYEIFNWPIKSTIYDIQLYFPQWHKWALSHCETSSMSSSQSHAVDSDVDVNSSTSINLSSQCNCHASSPYRAGEKWSLQEALVHTGQMFLDKSMTRNHWSLTLDPDHSILSTRKRNQMVFYAIYDCFTTTYLAYPVLQYWTFQQVAKINIVDLFQTSPSSSLHHGYNNIKNDTQVNKQLKKNIIIDGAVLISDDSDQSDEEIFLNRCDNQFNKKLLNENISDDNKENDDNLEQISEDDGEIYLGQVIEPSTIDGVDPPFVDGLDGVDPPFADGNNKINSTVARRETQGTVDIAQPVPDPIRQQHQQPRKKTLSAEAKKKKNKKKKRSSSLKLIRKIIRYYGVSFRHVKFQGDEVVIGVKSDKNRRQYEDILPSYCFDKKNYWRFK